MIPVHDFPKLHSTHTIQFTGKSFVGISPVAMELMFNEHIRGQYLTLGKTGWVEEEHEIMSDKGFLKECMSEE